MNKHFKDILFVWGLVLLPLVIFNQPSSKNERPIKLQITPDMFRPCEVFDWSRNYCWLHKAAVTSLPRVEQVWQRRIELALSSRVLYSRRRIKKGNQMITKTKRINWIQDIRDGFLFAGVSYQARHFNDLHKTCRRIKLYIPEDLTDEQLEKVQKYVQSKKKEYNVTVARWTGNRWYGNVVVYFRPKVGLSMQ